VALRRLLKVQYLTGFELPYTIALLAHALGSDVSGYDLSTLIRGDIKTPGDFLHSKNVFVSARPINERWDGGTLRRSDPNSTGTPEPDHALRAWFTAMYVKLTLLELFNPPTPLQCCRNGYPRLAIGPTIEHTVY
jgi:hypothetical protein